jgi:hypothetical protein
MITITAKLPIDPYIFHMNYIPTKKNYKYRFDFEIGYLVKSPCRECEIRDAFPGCMKDCVVLDRIHEVLSFGISCSKRAS